VLLSTAVSTVWLGCCGFNWSDGDDDDDDDDDGGGEGGSTSSSRGVLFLLFDSWNIISMSSSTSVWDGVSDGLRLVHEIEEGDGDEEGDDKW